MAQTIESYLDSTQLPQSAKADVWDAYHAPDTQGALDKLSLPRTVKADIWDLKYGGGSAKLPSPDPNWVTSYDQSKDPNAAGIPTPVTSPRPSDIPAGAVGPLPGIPAPSNPILAQPTTVAGEVGDAAHVVAQRVRQGAQFIKTRNDEVNASHPKVQSAIQWSNKPLVPQAVQDYVGDVAQHADTIPGAPNASAVLGGLDQGVGDAALGLTTPSNIGMLGASMIPGLGPVARVAGVGFGVQAGVQAAEQGKAAYDAYQQGDTQNAVRHGVGSLISTAFAGFGLKGHSPEESTQAPTPVEQTPSAVPEERPTGTPNMVQQSIPGIQGHLFNDAEHSVPTAAVEVKPPLPNDQNVTLPMQGRMFSQEGQPLSAGPTDVGPNVESSPFAVVGENLPPQEGTAAPMSPEAEAISQAATQGSEPTSPSEGTTGSSQTDVKSIVPEANPASAGTTSGPEPTSPEEGNSSTPTQTPAEREISDAIGRVVDSIPEEHHPHVSTIDAAVDNHFGTDTDGGMRTLLSALRIYKRGINEGNDWALMDALKEVRRQTPAPEIETRNAGATPKDIADSIQSVKNYIKPALTDADRLNIADAAAQARLGRYERMQPPTRSAYKTDLWSDEFDSLVNQGDPTGVKGYEARLQALRDTVQPSGFVDRTKKLLSDIGDQIDDAAWAKRTLQRNNGFRAGNDLQTRERMNNLAKTMDQWSIADSIDFVDRVDKGLDQGDPLKNQIASSFRASLDDARNRITAVNGDFQEYLKNYFPRIWANVGQGQELSHQFGHMTGSEDFLKGRKLDFFQEGIDKGLAPVSYNPAKVVMMRIEQMDRYVMKEQTAKDFISSGKAKLYKPGDSVPAGLTPLDDPAFQRAAGLGGQYYASNAIARIFNNFTSRGLSGAMKIPYTQLSAYDAFRRISNAQNMMQLSFSAMHGALAVSNSLSSELARGTALLTNGVLQGDRSMMGDGVKGVLKTFNVRQRYLLGRNLIAHMKDPATQQEMAALADAFKRAGGRVGMDKVLGMEYADRFKTSLKEARDAGLPKTQRAGAALSTILNGSGRVIELAAKPIMQYLIPQLKVGAFAMEAQDILAHNENLTADQIDSKLQRSWNNMDDRFGQVVYDNYFMNKVAKDIIMTTVRSPGWDIGTGRTLLGGIGDAAKMAYDAAKNPEKFGTDAAPQITARTTFLASQLALVMATNAVLHYAHTGQAPAQLVDYFFPKAGTKDENGEDNRLMPKSYVYDYINMAEHPITSAFHKVNPFVSTLKELNDNKSFYGREIFDPGKSVGGRMAQMIQWAAGQYVTPFSLSNYSEQSNRGNGGLSSFVQTNLGLLPAPKSAGRSEAEQLAYEYHAASMAQGGEEGDTYDTHVQSQKIQALMANGKLNKTELADMVRQGKVPIGLIDHFYSKQEVPNLERWTKSLSANRAMEVFERGTPAERQRLMPILLEKLDNLDPSLQKAYGEQLKKYLPSHHPDTHVFSQSKWGAANPGTDSRVAAAQAHAQGYEVHP